MENERFIAKKSLGQNFLTSIGAVLKIVEAGELTADETVLEIGPGKGVLTEKLLETGARVIAVEKDNRLIGFLKEKFAQNTNFTLIHGDILELSPETIQLDTEKPYKVIANLPYYITGVFFEHVFGFAHLPERIVVMLQKEVAQRIVSRDGKESILSQSIQAYGTPKYITTVSRGSFSPAPNVDSAVIQVTNISKQRFLEHHIPEKQFFDVLKRGFAHKRKLLKGNLETEEGMLISCKIEPSARAEELATEQWFCLAKKLF